MDHPLDDLGFDGVNLQISAGEDEFDSEDDDEVKILPKQREHGNQEEIPPEVIEQL